MRDFNNFVQPVQPIRRAEKYERLMEDNFKNQSEACALLALIDAEFRSDPMSTQCFDSRIVERVRYCVAKRAEAQKMGLLG